MLRKHLFDLNNERFFESGAEPAERDLQRIAAKAGKFNISFIQGNYSKFEVLPTTAIRSGELVILNGKPIWLAKRKLKPVHLEGAAEPGHR